MTKRRKAEHPDFTTFTRGATARSSLHYGVFVFRREQWKTPTPEQQADYQRRAAIVRKNGGYMARLAYEEAGENPRFTEADCRAMKRAVAKTNPDLKVVDSWNGVGYYGYSVAVSKR